MTDLYADNADVIWSAGLLDGMPALIVQADGPLLSAAFLGAEYAALKVRYLLDVTQLPKLVPETFVCYEGADGVMNPILACDPEPILRPLSKADKDGEPWVLILQFRVQGEARSRMFRTTEGVTIPVISPEGLPVFPYWIAPIPPT